MKKRYLISLFLILIVPQLLSGQNPQGFFLDDYKPKSAKIPDYIDYTKPSGQITTYIDINYIDTIAKVSNYLFGNNSNVYMTPMVNQPGLINHIKTLNPRVIRYPGGNLSNLFFWNAPKGKLPIDVPIPLYGGVETKYKENFWFGKDTSDSTMSIDNYYKMLEMTKSTGIICVNYSYARYGLGKNPVQTAAKLAADWVRYDKGRTKFWEIGNENFGPWQAGYLIDTTKNKDGQPAFISGELYGNHFKIFVDSMKAAAKEIGTFIIIGAGLVETPKDWAKPSEKYWNQGFFNAAGNTADFFIVHTYYTPYEKDSPPDVILNSAESESFNMMDYMKKICKDYNVGLKPVALTEWNIFAVGSKQSCSFINGMHATLVLGELIKNQFGLACRWNFANGYANGDDHGLFSKGDEPGIPLWNPRPAYYYMFYFQQFMGEHMIASQVKGNEDIVSYASKFVSGETGLIIVNKGEKNEIINIQISNNQRVDRYYFYSLTGGDDNGNFSQRVFVNGIGPKLKAGGPADFENIKAFSAKTEGGITISSPAYSVQFILIRSK